MQISNLLHKLERLRRWFITVEDSEQRRTLGGLRRVRRAEVHYREGIRCYEGMTWDHLLMHLIQVRDIGHRVAKSMVLHQMMAASTSLFVVWKEKKEKAEDPKTVFGGRGESPTILPPEDASSYTS